ncbi:MAG: PAS domain-containing protein [Gammaproteobacteria bacterium]|nr:PAS domain-containing protein [Gammaproteobacteria bacterium]MCP5199519.1 PAS domain-containing protein [Gammaproteobacteria bacterium]
MTADRSVRYVAGIGASAGGLEALEAFFAAVPSQTGMAFVVVQHLTPDFKSLMDELLARHTAMAIHVVEHGMTIEPNSVYLIPSRKMMTLDGERFALTERDPRIGLNLPIDHFFLSLAQEWRENAIGVVLSGTGSDGARGIRAIHEAGGLVLAQSLESARFDGMPRSAMATGVVDLVLAPSAIPQVLVDYVDHERTIAGRALADWQNAEDIEPFTPIYNLLSSRYGVEFKHYKPGTITRRIERRMALHGIATVDEYINLLSALPSEPLNLYRDLLIGVTEFFRDRGAWDVLESNIVPALCERISGERELRCWVPGVATGEEAYSLAMLFHEHLTRVGKAVNVRIFASDLHVDSLEAAGNGVYTASALGAVPSTRVARYFKRLDDDEYQVVPEIRSMVVFAKQNLISDPPFTRLDLISCRNVMIYFDQETQQRVLTTLHFALGVGGYLFLGPSESLGDIGDEFESVDRHWKIYTKRRDVRLNATIRAAERREPDGHSPILHWAQRTQPRHLAGRDISILRTYDVLLDRFVPPAVLVDANGRLVHTFNRGADYLQARAGAASLNILDLVHPDLRMAVSTGMQRAAKESNIVRYGGIRVRLTDDDERIVRAMVETLGQQNGGEYFLILFEEAHRVTAEDKAPVTSLSSESMLVEATDLDLAAVHGEHVARLEQELRYTKEYLQATVEELETSNEELQATNEELMAANEELQSTNEELHSVNEELYTVNKEYESKINELTLLTDDMDNLLSSTEIGTVFLDESLCIRRFTPAVARQFSLLSHDVGRPIAHLNRRINFPNFLGELGAVLESGDEREFEVRDVDGNWFLMRMHPYRREAGGIGGVVVTFVDISRIKHTSEQLEQRNENMQGFAYAVSHDMSEPLRMVAGFTRLLADRYAESLDDKGRQYVEQINAGAERLNAMLQGVLEYSRVVTRSDEREMVDFYDLVGDARQRLGPAIERSGARIETRMLPHRIEVDRRQMLRVVVELVDNAIKFAAKERTPDIRFDAKLENGAWAISMCDNGPGIPAAERERVFDIFARLHRDREQPGNGVGLAVARRVAERHGGALDCHENAGGGTCFVLTLPAPDDEMLNAQRQP